MQQCGKLIRPLLQVSCFSQRGPRESQASLVSCYRYLVTTTFNPCQPRKSPFAVLGIPPTATTEQIKASFRKLALQYHPDLLSHSSQNAAEESRMAEIVEAYERLMDRDYSMPHNSQLANLCEVLTLQELQEDRRFDVHAIWMRYEGDNNITDPGAEEGGTTTKLHSALSITIHPDSSVSDLKHELQAAYKALWNLQSRRLDRYGLAIGWELVVPNGIIIENEKREDDDSSGLTALGNHDFVKHTYDIPSNTLMHAIVQKYDSEFY